MSVCLPVYDLSDGSLLGVACADAQMADLFAPLGVFTYGEDSYVFIIDSHGDTLTHPLLQFPRYITTQDVPPARNILTLERSVEMNHVVRSMKM